MKKIVGILQMIEALSLSSSSSSSSSSCSSTLFLDDFDTRIADCLVVGFWHLQLEIAHWFKPLQIPAVLKPSRPDGSAEEARAHNTRGVLPQFTGKENRTSRPCIQIRSRLKTRRAAICDSACCPTNFHGAATDDVAVCAVGSRFCNDRQRKA